MPGWTIHTLCLATLLLFRFAPVGAGLAGAAVTVVSAIVIGRRGAGMTLRPTGGLFLLAAAVAVAGMLPRVWPCGADCQTALDYRTLLGVPVLWLAAPVYLLAALLLFGWRDRPAELAAWLVVGTSLFFIGLSIHLGVACGHCFAVHTCVVASLAGLLRGTTGWTLRMACAAVAASSLFALYRWDLQRADVAEPAAATKSSGTSAPTLPAMNDAPAPAAPAHEDLLPDGRPIVAAADAGRRTGTAATNRLRVEFVVSFHCGHCADEFEPMQQELAPFLGEGKAELVVRLVHARKEPASGALVQHAFAAAATGRHREFVGKVFALRRDLLKPAAAPGRPAADLGAGASLLEQLRNQDALLLTRAKEALDLSAETALVARHPRVFRQLLVEEEQHFQALGAAGDLPQVFLVDPANGATLDHLEHASVAAVVAAVRKRLAP